MSTKHFPAEKRLSVVSRANLSRSSWTDGMPAMSESPVCNRQVIWALQLSVSTQSARSRIHCGPDKAAKPQVIVQHHPDSATFFFCFRETGQNCSRSHSNEPQSQWWIHQQQQVQKSETSPASGFTAAVPAGNRTLGRFPKFFHVTSNQRHGGHHRRRRRSVLS